MKYLLFILCFPLLASAGKDFTVAVDPNSYPPKKFRKNKHTLVQPMAKEPAHPDALPDAAKRERVFSRVPGLAKFSEKLDQLDRDLLYMRARNNESAELKEKYPEIPQETLDQLQREAKKE